MVQHNTNEMTQPYLDNENFQPSKLINIFQTYELDTEWVVTNKLTA